MQESAGTLVYRAVGGSTQVLLVHPSGNYNRRAPWSIPKGIPNLGEELEAAARRETLEETGVVPGRLAPLGSITYRKSRKRVHCFAGPAPDHAAPRCASWEIDAAEFMALDEAGRRLHVDQIPFLDRLRELLAGEGATP